ncbi:MAG: DUF2635 domain-containing protein [Pseudomonadota bacterium]
MSEQIFIKPKTDVEGNPYKVRLPHKPFEFLPAEGASVEKSAYWLRRIKDGSVEIAKPIKSGAKNTSPKE